MALGVVSYSLLPSNPVKAVCWYHVAAEMCHLQIAVTAAVRVLAVNSLA